jgi:hypothetical protein
VRLIEHPCLKCTPPGVIATELAVNAKEGVIPYLPRELAVPTKEPLKPGQNPAVERAAQNPKRSRVFNSIFSIGGNCAKNLSRQLRVTPVQLGNEFELAQVTVGKLQLLGPIRARSHSRPPDVDSDSFGGRALQVAASSD